MYGPGPPAQGARRIRAAIDAETGKGRRLSERGRRSVGPGGPDACGDAHLAVPRGLSTDPSRGRDLCARSRPGNAACPARVDTGIAGAIARAVADTRASTLAIGWDGRPSATRAVFGGVLDHLLDETRAQVRWCRRDWTGTRRSRTCSTR